ncbi:glucokinase [Streptomonospora alba]|uniref:Glucokinase n=1 Tax=Streptomonospora alba TaxID=183763 RepID=A0A0C2JNK3_9ACTN|nr:glucokinase [Streptomonospora alba]KIH98412.1 glucokinase [Streptomonospora alba]
MSRPQPPSKQRPWLVADIGGTNARFGLVEEPGTRPERVRRLEGAEHADLAAAATAYLEQVGATAEPGAACVAVAGPVGGDRVRLTNSHWDFSAAATRGRLGLDHLEVVNDFAALALSLPRLGGADLVSLGGPDTVPEGPMAVLGPGTGLGVAGLVPAEGAGWVPVPGEGGHVDVPAVDEREWEIVRLLRARQGAVTAECLLCGPGLGRLHGALAEVRGVAAPERTAAEICAEATEDRLCAEALDVFCCLLGGFAGNAALSLGATGGVFLGGGILPRIIPVVRSSGFRRRFEDKHRMNDYLHGIATMLIVAQDPALLGAAARLDQRLETVQGDVHEPAQQ